MDKIKLCSKCMKFIYLDKNSNLLLKKENYDKKEMVTCDVCGIFKPGSTYVKINSKK